MELIITSSEFRSNQKKYLDLADKTPIFITRAGKNPLCITRVPLDNVPTQEELKAIKEGLLEYKEGKTIKIEDVNNIWKSIL